MNLNKIEFKDLPSEETPLDAATLNTMQDNIEDCILANKGVIEFEGTIESPIDANKIVNVGVYKISGNKINFYNNETETLILEVTLNNTALVQSITTSEGIALRVGQYADFGEWNVLTGEKQVGYENEELEGTEKILIEESDFDGVDTVELADVVQTLEGNETDKVPSVSAVNEGMANSESAINSVLNTCSKVVYSSASLGGSYTFPTGNAMYLAIFHVSGDNLCTFDIINVMNSSLNKTRIKASSSYLTVTYENMVMTFEGEYTVMAKIIKL